MFFNCFSPENELLPIPMIIVVPYEHCNLALHPIFGATYGDMDISVEVEISSISPARNSNSTMRVPHFVFTSEDCFLCFQTPTADNEFRTICLSVFCSRVKTPCWPSFDVWSLQTPPDFWYVSMRLRQPVDWTTQTTAIGTHQDTAQTTLKLYQETIVKRDTLLQPWNPPLAKVRYFSRAWWAFDWHLPCFFFEFQTYPRNPWKSGNIASPTGKYQQHPTTNRHGKQFSLYRCHTLPYNYGPMIGVLNGFETKI